MIDYACEPYSPALQADFIRLFAQEGFERNAERLDWIMNPPTGRGEVAVARDEGAVVGLAAMIPMFLSRGNDRRQASFVFDVIVDRATRGRNIFSGLARTLHEGSAKAGRDWIWGFPNQIAARGWFGRYRWTNLGHPPLAVRPLRTGALFARVHPTLRRINIPLALSFGGPPTGFERVTQFEPESDAFWKAARAQNAWAVDRDHRWMTWRLLEGPDPSRVAALRSPQGHLDALVATRTVRKGALRVASLLYAAALPGRERRLSGLLRHELAFAARQGADLAMAWNSESSPVHRTILRGGFVPIPIRFRPSPTFIGGRDLSEGGAFLSGEDAFDVRLMDLDSV